MDHKLNVRRAKDDQIRGTLNSTEAKNHLIERGNVLQVLGVKKEACACWT